MKTQWRTKTLEDSCQFINGLWKGEKPPFTQIGVIRNTNFTKEGTLDDKDIAYLDVEVKKLEKRRLQFGDVILEKSGGGPKQAVGRVALFDKEDGVFSFSNFTAALRVRDPHELDFRFLHKFLHWTYLSGVTEGMQSHSTGIRNLDGDAYKAIQFKFPPLPEQQRIVGILDEAFEGIATAKANAEKNLKNARAIFDSHLQSVFTQRGLEGESLKSGPPDDGGDSLDTKATVSKRHYPKRDSTDNGEVRVTKTGGRNATLRHIPGDYSLAVGMPNTPTRKGWRWNPLTELARLESGHTPSRRHPEYWGGSIPWIGIQDARERHGRRIDDTLQKTNESGIANSSARVLPKNTVCLSRTASVGYVVVMGRQMATSQDFVNWVCSNGLSPDFLKYVFLAEGRRGLHRFASGSVHQTIYFPEAKAFHVCHPVISEQLRIVSQLDSLQDETERLEAIYQKKLAALEELKKSLLRQAFAGELLKP